MFTGIVEGMGNIKSIEKNDQGVSIEIDLRDIKNEAEIGESISIDGVCLTVAKIQGEHLFFDIIPETLSKTSFNKLETDQAVNFERSLEMGQKISGHIVQGHVDGTSEIDLVQDNEEGYVVFIKIPEEMRQFIVRHGSIAVNGVSLTVARLNDDSFGVALIPTTLELTNLGKLRPGDEVNIEVDIGLKQLVRWLKTNKEVVREILSNDN